MSSKIMPLPAALLRNFRSLRLNRAMIGHTVEESIAPLQAGDFNAFADPGEIPFEVFNPDGKIVFAEGLFLVKARSATDQEG